MPTLSVAGNRHVVRVSKPKPETKVLAAAPASGFTGIIDRTGNPINMANIYSGGRLFIVLSGPSLNTLDLRLLDQRGVITMGVNNSPCVYRPHLWTYGDTSSKFHSAIFRDPGILKFVPHAKLTDIVYEKVDGQFRSTGRQVSLMPGVVGIHRNDTFSPTEWLWENTFNWGNGEEASQKNGLPNQLSTMLQAMKLAYYLGFRSVYLVGCDFKMQAEQPYAFRQDKSTGGVRTNNRMYLTLQMFFEMLLPHFHEANFHVYNATPRSALTVFPRISYEEAIRQATQGCQNHQDTEGWYGNGK